MIDYLFIFDCNHEPNHLRDLAYKRVLDNKMNIYYLCYTNATEIDSETWENDSEYVKYNPTNLEGLEGINYEVKKNCYNCKNDSAVLVSNNDEYYCNNCSLQVKYFYKEQTKVPFYDFGASDK